MKDWVFIWLLSYSEIQQWGVKDRIGQGYTRLPQGMSQPPANRVRRKRPLVSPLLLLEGFFQPAVGQPALALIGGGPWLHPELAIAM